MTVEHLLTGAEAGLSLREYQDWVQYFRQGDEPAPPKEVDWSDPEAVSKVFNL